MQFLWKRWEQLRKATFVAARLRAVEEETKEADAKRRAQIEQSSSS